VCKSFLLARFMGSKNSHPTVRSATFDLSHLNSNSFDMIPKTIRPRMKPSKASLSSTGKAWAQCDS